MKLKVLKRKAERKSDTHAVRLKGSIPAILYGRNRPSRPIAVDGAEFQAGLRALAGEPLATVRMELVDEGHVIPVLVKEVHYYPTTYDVLHLDFFAFDETVPVLVDVPIQLQGMLECVGVKLGGFVRQVIRSLRVRCLRKDLPKFFPLDIAHLNVGESLRLSAIQIPEGVRPMAQMNEVAALITKKA